MKYTYKERIKEHGLLLFSKIKKWNDKWLEVPDEKVEKCYQQALCQIVEKISKKGVGFQFNEKEILGNDNKWYIKTCFTNRNYIPYNGYLFSKCWYLTADFGNNKTVKFVIKSTADQVNIVDEISRTLITLYGNRS